MPSHAADLARRLARNAEAVCRHYLSNGRREGRYWLVGDVANNKGRSLFVRLSGPDHGKGAAGKWTDAASGQHGDLLDLIGLNRGLDRLRDILDEARAFLALPPDPLPSRQDRLPAPRGSGGSEGDSRAITNVVMMGMGEPLYNFENVRDALKIVMDGDGLALSKRRITLSTSGVVPMMERAGAEIGVNLAVSLHAVTKEIRDEIVPINRKYGIEELLQACADYPGVNNARRITFEYVMLKDKNDSDEDARELVRLIKKYRLPAKVNLIPFNPWPGAPYDTSTPERVRSFSNIVFEAGISAPVRTPRGRDIDAACGQLKTSSEKKSRAELDRLAEEKLAALG